MAAILSWFRTYGAEGATANAWAACEQRSWRIAAVEARLRRLHPPAAATPGRRLAS